MSYKIEMLRAKMVQVAMQKGSFVDQSVIEISQELDELILLYQQEQRLKR